MIRQTWRRLLFAHWRADPASLLEKLPYGLELDLHEGSAWLGLALLEIAETRAFGFLHLPGPFAQLNVRTYVKRVGEPGVHFLTVACGSTAAVLGARLAYGVPFRRADVSLDKEGEGWAFVARGALSLEARYRPSSPAKELRPGTLEHWQLERYALFSRHPAGLLLRAGLSHSPWIASAAEASVSAERLGETLGIRLLPEPPRFLFADRKDAVLGVALPA